MYVFVDMYNTYIIFHIVYVVYNLINRISNFESTNVYLKFSFTFYNLYYII